jgi:hypothetical protein
VDFLWKRIQSWVNKRGDGQLTSHHQPSDNDCDNIQNFHHDFLQKKLVLQATIAARFSKGMDQ